MRRTTRLLVVSLAAVGLAAGCRDARQVARKTLAAEISLRQRHVEESLRQYKLGAAARANGDNDKAAAWFQKATSTDKQNAQAWMLLGIVEFDRGNMFEAARAFHQAATLEPDRYEPHFNLGTVFEACGQYRQAIGAYESALRIAPHQLEVMENLARCYVRSRGEPRRAKQLIDAALAREDRPAWRGWLQAQSEKFSAAGDTNQ